MIIDRYQPINDLCAIANLQASVFKEKLETLPALLETIGRDLASGAFHPPEDVAKDLKDDLHIVQIRTARIGSGQKPQQIATQIAQIIPFLGLVQVKVTLSTSFTTYLTQ